MKKHLIPMVLVLLLILCGCSAKAPESEAELFRISVSFRPMLYLTRMITDGVEGVEVSCMAETNTGCLHDYQLLPKDVKNLAEADIFICNGLGMESFLEQLLEQLPDLTVAEAGASLADKTLSDGDEVNGHVWLSVDYAKVELRAIAEALIAADADHAEAYKANLDAALEKMDALERDMETLLAPVSGMSCVCFHEGFAYTAEEFGIETCAVMSLHEEKPGTRELADLIREISERESCCLLIDEENAVNSAAISTADETGLSLTVLDPLTGGTGEPDIYFSVMRENAQKIAEALS